MQCDIVFNRLEGLPDYIYVIAFAFTGLAWLTLIIFPRQSWANLWFAGVIAPVILGVVYTFVLFYYFFSPYTSHPLHFFTLDGLRCLFLKDGLLLAGFLDLLLLPLVVGAWMARKAAQIRMPYVFLFICYMLTFAFPGTGFVAFALFVSIGGKWKLLQRYDSQPPVNTDPVLGLPESA